MLQRLAIILISLTFATQALAGSFVCDRAERADAGKIGCFVQDQGNCEELSHKTDSCSQGESPAGSLAAMVCCELICGQSTNSTQFETTTRLEVPTPSVATSRLPALDSLPDKVASALLREADEFLLHRAPPDLYLYHSTFLI